MTHHWAAVTLFKTFTYLSTYLLRLEDKSSQNELSYVFKIWLILLYTPYTGYSLLMFRQKLEKLNYSSGLYPQTAGLTPPPKKTFGKYSHQLAHKE